MVRLRTSSLRYVGARVGQGHLKLTPGPCRRPTMGAPICRRSTRHLLGISPVGVLASSPRDVGARVSQGHLKLIPSPCRRPTMGAPIRRRSTRHLLGISPVEELSPYPGET